MCVTLHWDNRWAQFSKVVVTGFSHWKPAIIFQRKFSNGIVSQGEGTIFFGKHGSSVIFWMWTTLRSRSWLLGFCMLPVLVGGVHGWETASEGINRCCRYVILSSAVRTKIEIVFKLQFQTLAGETSSYLCISLMYVCTFVCVCRCCLTMWLTRCTAMSRWRQEIPDINKTSFYHHQPHISTHLLRNRWQTHSKPTIYLMHQCYNKSFS